MPPKIKEFMWRLLRDIVPSKARLLRPGITIDVGCRVCGLVEDREHIFIDCSTAKEVWQLWGRGSTCLALPFVDCFAALVRLHSKKILEHFCTICWRLWSARNERLWNNVEMPPGLILSKALEIIYEWREAYKTQSLVRVVSGVTDPIQDNDRGWHLFVDGALFEQEHKCGMGAICMSENGGFMAAFSAVDRGFFSPCVVEAMALKRTLDWVVRELNGEGVVFMDAQSVCFSIESDEEDWSEYGAIIEDCRSLLTQRPDIKVKWICRELNKAAHMLARRSFLFDCFKFWDVIPYCLVNVICLL